MFSWLCLKTSVNSYEAYFIVLRSACVMCILFCFSLSCLSVFLFAPLLGRCLLADSTANHHSDVMMSANQLACQLYLRTRVDCVDCQRTLCSNTVSSLCSSPIVYRCLMYLVSRVMLCCAIWSIYRSVPCLLTCIEFCVEDNADARIGVSVLLCQVQSKVYVDASG